MKYLDEVIENLTPTFTQLDETAMPPQDARDFLEDQLSDAAEYGDISSEAMDDVWDNDKLMAKMTDAFAAIVNEFPEDQNHHKFIDAIYDAALEVYHQHVGSVKNKEK